MSILQEVQRMIKLVITPIKMLPLSSDYQQGQIDMANTISRLIDVMENGKETNDRSTK